jgi:hypothetical protein
MNYRIAVFLLCIFPNIVYAMRRIDIVPRGSHNKAKQRCCAWFTCCKTRAQKEREKQAMHKLRNAKSVDLRRATGGAISEEAIKEVKAHQQAQEQAQKAEDAAQQTLSIARAVTPLAGLLSLPGSEQVTARPSVSATQPPQLPSPTP